jgi:hypothetical protein
MSDAAVSEPQSLLLRLQHQSFGEDNREDTEPTKGKVSGMSPLVVHLPFN